MYGLFRGFSFEIYELGLDAVGTGIVDGAVEEDDPLLFACKLGSAGKRRKETWGFRYHQEP